MDRKWVKFGIVLFGLWLLVLIGIATSYKVVESSRTQVEELGHSIDSLRNSFYFDAAYRTKMVDRQALDLQLIYAQRLQIDAYYQKSWLTPDLNQLLLTTDRFVEQAQAYLDHEFAVKTLAQQIYDTRDNYPLTGQLANQYFQLSANVFEAMYLSEQANAEILRHVDYIYQQSTELEGKDKRALQSVLAEVSRVLGSYAQGSYLVDKLITHDVSKQIIGLKVEYRRTLTYHVLLGVLLTFMTMIGYLGLLYLAHTSQRRATPTSVTPTPNIESGFEHVVSPSQPKQTSEPQINFDIMLSSLNGDVESVCMLLEVFVADHVNDVEEIERLLMESPEEAQRKAHSLKGVGGNLGAAQLKEAATKVESAIQNEITQVSTHLAELQLCLDTAIEEAQTFLKQQNDS